MFHSNLQEYLKMVLVWGITINIRHCLDGIYAAVQKNHGMAVYIRTVNWFVWYKQHNETLRYIFQRGPRGSF